MAAIYKQVSVEFRIISRPIIIAIGVFIINVIVLLIEMREPGNIEKTKGWAALVALLRGSTQVELADRLDLRQSAISAIVNLHKKPNVREVIALSREGIAPELWVQPLAKAPRRGAA